MNVEKRQVENRDRLLILLANIDECSFWSLYFLKRGFSEGIYAVAKVQILLVYVSGLKWPKREGETKRVEKQTKVLKLIKLRQFRCATIISSKLNNLLYLPTYHELNYRISFIDFFIFHNTPRYMSIDLTHWN